MDWWRRRLLDAADRSGRSDRAISLAAGLGPNALNEIRNTDKEPSVERVLKLIDEIGVSQSHVWLGIDLTPELEEVIQLLGAASLEVRQGFATLLRAQQPGAAKPMPQAEPLAEAPEKPEESQ